MASIDDELLMDEQENSREIAFIRDVLPGALKKKFTDKQLLFILDAIANYFYTSGILESTSDDVEIDMEAVSDFICSEAEKEGEGPFVSQEVFFIVLADIEYHEHKL